MIGLVLCLSTDVQGHVLTPLAPDAQATHKAVMSGSWSSAATWGGVVPGTDAKVIIPAGVVVTVDKELGGTAMFWIRVDGTLKFAASVNTALTADSVFVNMGGRLEIGSALTPIQADKTAKLIIKARNGLPIDQAWDPTELSRGVVAEGMVAIQGAPKTAWTTISTMPALGDTTLTLDVVPSGWRPGDTLVLTAPVYDQDETFSLVKVVGSTVTLDHPMTFARVVPRPGLAFHVANLTRNAQILSADVGSSKLQGHLMLMGGGHEIRYGGFYDLGRTTIKPVSDPLVLPDGSRDPSLAPLCGLTEENVRGRYAVHFHNAGPDSARSHVDGSVVSVQRRAGFKIGYINHSSNVSFRDNIGYQIDGAHFMTEEGNEVGEFVGNLAIYSRGSNFPVDDQPGEACMNPKYPEIHNRRRLDVGHRGHGFWIHSGAVDVVSNVATSQDSSGFDLWTRPLNHPMKTNTFLIQFPVPLLRDNGPWALGKATIPINAVPAIWLNNTAYVSGGQKHARKTALSLHYHGTHQVTLFPKSPKNLIDGFQAWNVQNGIVTTYLGWFRFQNVELIGGDYQRATTLGMGLTAQGGNNMDLSNIRIDNFKFPLRTGTTFTCVNVTVAGILTAC